MSKTRVYIIVFFILILAFLAVNFSYPKFWNERIGIGHFPDRPFKLGLDLQGGIHLIYQADLADISEQDREEAMNGLRDIIERRVNLFGVREPLVQAQKDRLVVELAGIIEPSEAIQLIGQTPFLEFREPRDKEETEAILEKQKQLLEQEESEETLTVEDQALLFEDPYFQSTLLTGRYLKKTEVIFDQITFQPQISLEFDSEGAKLFEEITARNIEKPLAIYIDGVLISAPVVQEAIAGGKAQITGQFTIEEARELARNLNAGALPIPIHLIAEQTVGPTLGADSLAKSLKAGVFGFLAIIIFMVIFYRLPGLLAALVLAIYISLALSVFKLIPVTLTLAGIAGFILSIGMAIDANILIFSRMKEEMSSGKKLGPTIEDGFQRAWSSIRDGNLTTLIVALILFSFGTSFVKGFALTLILGILISMFSAIFITKNFLKVFEGTKWESVKWLWK